MLAGRRRLAARFAIFALVVHAFAMPARRHRRLCRRRLRYRSGRGHPRAAASGAGAAVATAAVGASTHGHGHGHDGSHVQSWRSRAGHQRRAATVSRAVWPVDEPDVGRHGQPGVVRDRGIGDGGGGERAGDPGGGAPVVGEEGVEGTASCRKKGEEAASKRIPGQVLHQG